MTEPTNYTYPGEVWHDGQHRYLSTACLHGHHAHCQCDTNLQGQPKIPGTCKWCKAPCICSCHAER